MCLLHCVVIFMHCVVISMLMFSFIHFVVYRFLICCIPFVIPFTFVALTVNSSNASCYSLYFVTSLLSFLWSFLIFQTIDPRWSCWWPILLAVVVTVCSYFVLCTKGRWNDISHHILCIPYKFLESFVRVSSCMVQRLGCCCTESFIVYSWHIWPDHSWLLCGKNVRGWAGFRRDASFIFT